MNALSTQVSAGQNDTLLTQIVDAVARAEQCGMSDLPPLYDAVDLDALTRIAEGPGTVEVTFQYLGYTVTVETDGPVRIGEA